MKSNQLNQGHYLWPKQHVFGPNAARHEVREIRVIRGYRMFDVQPDTAPVCDPNWLTFTQVRSNFSFNPPA